MTSAQIQAYAKYTIPQLRAKCQAIFNRMIRERDKGKPCISCGEFKELQAGHYYSAGHHRQLALNPDNVHGQCRRCNYFLSGNLTNYRKGLIARIGQERVVALDRIAEVKRKAVNDRFELIEFLESNKK